MDTSRRLAAVVLLAGGLLAACGGGDKTSSTSTGSGTGGEASAAVSLPGKVNDKGTKTASGATLELEQDDFYFSPTFVKAAGGTTMKVTLKNEGNATHTFTIASPAVDVTVDAGKTATAEVALPATGTVPFFCRFHQGQGMQGAFVVS
jgi:plastocyanin